VGNSPEREFQRAANRTINETLARQAEQTANLTEQQREFIGPGYGNYKKVLKKIGGASGTTFSEYVDRSRREFFDTAARLTEEGQRGLERFQPDLITSRSTDLTSKYLAALGQKFANEIEGVATRAGSRLDRLPGEAQKAFSASAQNPAFENLANAQYMNFSKNPPTVQTDIAITGRPFMTYNV
jgi:hypothetical protein